MNLKKIALSIILLFVIFMGGADGRGCDYRLPEN